jgi:hypothetical protein
MGYFFDLPLYDRIIVVYLVYGIIACKAAEKYACVHLGKLLKAAGLEMGAL